MTIESTTAEIAADYIRNYDPALAAAFLAQPFNRVALAQAFAKGLKPKPGTHDYEMGATIIALAELDRTERMEANEGESK